MAYFTRLAALAALLASSASIVSAVDDSGSANGVTAQSGCQGGSSFACSDQSPWAVSDDLAYGFAAVTSSNPACCQCFQLTFTDGPIQGKQMIVQATNTGDDVDGTQSRVVASVYSTAAPSNGEQPRMSGALNTAALAPTHVPNSRPSSRTVAVSAGIG
ncbi:MAG: hypothetical protein LQ337_006310 [Flavoplaca oasis]|nr:MAG: hypothetical protein LQ337_006310 [Flavoplaca oasis]